MIERANSWSQLAGAVWIAVLAASTLLVATAPIPDATLEWPVATGRAVELYYVLTMPRVMMPMALAGLAIGVGVSILPSRHSLRCVGLLSGLLLLTSIAINLACRLPTQRAGLMRSFVDWHPYFGAVLLLGALWHWGATIRDYYRSVRSRPGDLRKGCVLVGYVVSPIWASTTLAVCLWGVSIAPVSGTPSLPPSYVVDWEAMPFGVSSFVNSAFGVLSLVLFVLMVRSRAR